MKPSCLRRVSGDRLAQIVAGSEYEPAYSLAEARRIVGDRLHFTAIDVLNLDTLHDWRRVEFVLRKDLMSHRQMHLYGYRLALAVIADAREWGIKFDERSIEAVESKKRWLNGEIARSELVQAHHAAWRVARRSLIDGTPRKISDAADTLRIASRLDAHEASWSTFVRCTPLMGNERSVAILRELILEATTSSEGMVRS